MARRFPGLTALLAGVFLLAGCAATSAPFKFTAAKGGPYVAQYVGQYTAADTALGADAKAAQYAAAEALSKATAVEKAVEYEATRTAYEAARPIFFRYTDADASLTPPLVPGGPTLRSVIQSPARDMDEAIKNEGERRAKWWFIPGQ